MNTLSTDLTKRDITHFIGIYDVLSASLAARYYDAVFVSGFGFAASHYGLPDIGFNTWTDVADLVRRIRTVLPETHILVDIDDGYGDPEIAAHSAAIMESYGASGVVLEDQQRPRKCGHFDGKQLMSIDGFVEKLGRVLSVRKDLFVVARTDASDFDDIARRVDAFTRTGVDAILVDAVTDLSMLESIRELTPLPLAFNRIAGGKSPECIDSELKAAGVSLVIYSTPCLFAAQEAIESAMKDIKTRDGQLPAAAPGRVGISECTRILQDNLDRRYQEAPTQASKSNGRSLADKS